MAKIDRMRTSYATYFTQMTDNAMLRDMAVADIHFVPHTDELNGLGVDRLDRLATLLNVYGGVVRYETQLSDQTLVTHRLEHVSEYLALAGCNMDRVKVAVMRSGGHGLPGDEAVNAYRNGTANTNDGDAASGLSNAGVVAPRTANQGGG